jgi:D-alanyl-D-alanine carboxypeptidase/D-alanyl-D-alanine-endopeptidase (penicillin-binding protein 4)
VTARSALVAVVVLLGAGLGPAAGAAGAAGTDPPASALPRLATPVFSIRRVPALVSKVAADVHLGADLDQVMSQPVLAGARDHACLVVGDAAGPGSRYTRQPAMQLIPASTMKLLTSTAALAQIGPDTRLTTEVRAASPPADGTVGDLWLVGGGDPLLSTAAWAADAGYQGQPRLATSVEALADKVVAAGVRRVQGRILGDDSRYDAQRTVPSWNPRYIQNFEISPLSALVVNKAYASTNPPTLASSPPAHAAGVLAGLLRARGVTVGGSGEGKAPAGATVVTSIDSPPLSEVVGEILQQSDNMGAEMLVKEIGVRAGAGGTTTAGLGVVADQLRRVAGVAPGEVAAVDGSGLDRSDHVSCDLLGRVLDKVGADSPLVAALPVAGRNGTLHRRFLGTPAVGKIRAKTGSLEGVAGLAGFATTSSGATLEFALLANDLPSEAVGNALQDRVVNVLIGYPRAPSAEELGPETAVPVPVPPAK